VKCYLKLHIDIDIDIDIEPVAMFDVHQTIKQVFYSDPQPDLQNILRQSHDFLTIIPKLRSTYDGHRIYKTSNEGRRAFIRYNLLAKS